MDELQMSPMHAGILGQKYIYSQTLLFWPNDDIIIIEYSLTPVTNLHKSLRTLDW